MKYIKEKEMNTIKEKLILKCLRNEKHLTTHKVLRYEKSLWFCLYAWLLLAHLNTCTIFSFETTKTFTDTPTGEPITLSENELNNLVELFRELAAIRDSNKTPK